MSRIGAEPRRRQSVQRGQVLLAMLAILGIAAGALIYATVSPASLTIENEKKTAAALAQAKDALIGRAAADQNRPGSLPCPDLVTNIPGTNIPNDGIADLLVGNECPSYIGRLPWRTLGLPDLRDSSGERLWYALSRTFRDDDSAQPINSDTAGELTVNSGSATLSGVIAVVLAPGGAAGSQARDAANQNTVAHYLEGGNEIAGTTTFTAGAVSGSANDRLLAVTSDALFPVVEMRVAREVRAFLAAYFDINGYYPFANSYSDNSYGCTPLLTSGRIPQPGVPLGQPISATCPGLADWQSPGPAQPPAWFAANNWHRLTHYSMAPACGYPNSLGSCFGAGGLLTVQGMPVPNDDKRAVVIVTGRAFPGQSRPCATPDDCLEDPENTNGDGVFVKPVLSPANNDRLVIVSP
ncbi:MAG: hypothetical protein HY526_13395 [Betaproteobacteria bacterium]|nr:hypothetical protein [Betaproteobacteria bacterium]